MKESPALLNAIAQRRRDSSGWPLGGRIQAVAVCSLSALCGRHGRVW